MKNSTKREERPPQANVSQGKGPGMRQRVSEFLGNESSFGRLMQCLWVIIGGNLMFVLFSLPVITIGPALAGLYRVALRFLRGDRDLSPILEFWRGFTSNLRQGILSWLAVLGFFILATVDVRFCSFYGGIFSVFKLLIYGLSLAFLLLTIHFYPVLSAFSDTMGGLVRNALFFAAKNPIRSLAILALHIFPVLISYVNTRLQPLYVFLWASCGFGLIAMLTSLMLKKDFERFLPEVDAFGNPLTQEEIKEREKKNMEELLEAETGKEHLPTGKEEELL